MRKFFKSKKGLVASLLMLPLFIVGGFAVANHAQASSNCNSDNLLYCGRSTPSSFIKTVKANTDGAPYHHTDLQAVYAHFGLEPNQYDQFSKYAEQGTLYPHSGKIVVDGQTVATNTKSIGRNSYYYMGSGHQTIKVNGHSYYAANNSGVYAASVTELPVMVMFNNKGQMQFAVINDCGNPTWGTAVTPTYSCNALQKKSLGNNTYEFTTSASAAHNASVAKVVYNFGDGTTATEKSPSTPVKHKFGYGKHTVTVTVYVHLPGNQTVTVKSTHCETIINIPPPPVVKHGEAVCKQLQSNFSGSPREYEFAAYGSTNLAKLTGATFDFGDGNTANVKPASALTAVTNHTYAKDGDYTITAQLHFDVYTTSNGKVSETTPKTVNCATNITVSTPKPSAMACVSLQWGQPGESDAYGSTEETLIAQASATNATINSYTFDFGDSSQNQTVKTSNASATVNHTYKPGQYVATVSVSITDNKGTHTVTSVNCQANLKLTPPECVPGSKKPECVCKYDHNLPPESPECKAPTPPPTLPNTGPGSTIALFVGSSLVAGLAYQLVQKYRSYSRA